MTFVHRHSVICSALLVAAAARPVPAFGQLVQGRLSETGTGSPIEGALVLLIDGAGVQRGGVLTDETGRFRVRAPGPGRYSVRAERIGFETATSEFFQAGSGPADPLTLEMSPLALVLEGIRVEARRRCATRPEEGMLVAQLWEETNKALRNQQWTDRMGLVRFRLVQYERDLDPETRVTTVEDRRTSGWVGRNPIRSLAAEDLLERGFVRPDAAGGYDYYGPDAAVLLSDAFLETHCFGLAASAQAPDLIGVTFEPLNRRGHADIAGTLWLGASDLRLRSLEFSYTWSPWAEASGVANGRMEFEELPGGAWIIRSWWIRMPRMVQDSGLMTGGRSGLRVAAIVEHGGAAMRVDVGSATAIGAGRGRVRGTVWDSTRARPLGDAEVFLVDGPGSGVTDAEGRFTLEEIPSGTHELGFRHPRLDSLPVVPAPVEVSVAAGETSDVPLAIPSLPAILTAICGTGSGDEGLSAVVGVVRDRSGAPVAGAAVALEWTDYRVAGGRELRADVTTRRTTADARGRYAACAPPGVLLDVRASSGNTEGPIRRAEIPRGNVVVLDLSLRAPS